MFEMVASRPPLATTCELEITLEVELDSARIAPSVKPLAAARLCACVVAEVIRPESEQVCDCANCCEIWVPITLNDTVSPLFCLVRFCCTVVKLATVAFMFAIGAGKVKDQLRVGARVVGIVPSVAMV